MEENKLTFVDHWTGTGTILNGDKDAERLRLDPGEYMISDVVNTGTYTVELDQNHYDPSGDDAIMSYRTADTAAQCVLEAWVAYAGTFDSLGFVQVKVEMAA